MIVETGSAVETEQLASQVREKLSPGDVLVLTGDLGAGKTTFTRGLARAMGIDPNVVSSPTFTLINIYPGTPALIHVDFYRIPDGGDIFFEELDDALNGDAIVVIEWGDRFLDQLREMVQGKLFIGRFRVTGEEIREIVIEEDSHH
ncbi:MAG: tRNA (adenosine(37)-N6)-threonylcarbamoyltransferase complex ATPase subunit type 1 TsaE [Acidobacteria bacterium]|nr:tRNA (adenosine(37)-N6)-threonylcarbamoyltransferase complex ATPase subunit type 1 TsaE [Acidobacteriota bacterium]